MCGIVASVSSRNHVSSERLLSAARHVHVSSFFLLHALRPDLPSLLRGAREAGATTSVDPNWDPGETWDSGLRDVLAETDVLFVNEEEALRIAGAESVEVAARELARTVGTVVVKRGAAGALAVEGDHLVQAPARPVDAVDAIGAGDSFDAGFISALLSGRSLAERLAFANACGALSMRAAGGTRAQPTLAEATEG